MLALDAGDIAVAALTNTGFSKNIGCGRAEPEKDNRLAARKQHLDHAQHQGPPERKMAARLVRVDIDAKARQRQGCVEQQHALADPAVGDHIRRLERP
ncbi:hypothetical protein D3C71_1757790 [compost metagenome]